MDSHITIITAKKCFTFVGPCGVISCNFDGIECTHLSETGDAIINYFFGHLRYTDGRCHP